MNKDPKDDTILARWLSGELTEKEMQELEATTDLKALKTKLDMIRHLDYPEFSAAEMWERQGQQILSKPTLPAAKAPRKMHWIRWAVIAAGLLLLLGIFWYLQSPSTQLLTKVGGQSVQVWADGSFAHLNALSTLHWDKEWTNNRSLQLDGEAFFSVTPGAPFTINTANGNISVLGTRFNVRSRASSLAISCYEGKVKVTQGKLDTLLLAGQGVELIQQKWKSLLVENSQPSWIQGKSTFRQVLLVEVFQELERQYQIQLEIVPEINGREFTGQFPHEDLSKALQLICEPMGLYFQQTGDKVRIY